VPPLLHIAGLDTTLRTAPLAPVRLPFAAVDRAQ
jgi:hypothetical protein